MQDVISVEYIDFELHELLHESIMEIDREHMAKFAELLISIRSELLSRN
ncbi:MAG: hypothetical protein LBN34_03135 [Clostridiales Family XIII bacterium]|nr:hypothetical protein [Clostridiales Family XIII bacterium]